MIFIDFSQVLLKKRLKKSLELLCLKINKQKYNQMGGENFLDKKEQILDLYFDKHLKQIQISKMVNASQQYISKIIKNDKRYENEKSFRKSSNAEKRKITQAEYQKNYVRRKEKDIVYEQLLEQQKQDSIELSYNPYLLSDYAFTKANSSIYSYNSIKNQFVMIRGINAGFDAPKRISMNVY